MALQSKAKKWTELQELFFGLHTRFRGFARRVSMITPYFFVLFRRVLHPFRCLSLALSERPREFGGQSGAHGVAP